MTGAALLAWGGVMAYALAAAATEVRPAVIARVAAIHGIAAEQRVLAWERLIRSGRGQPEAEKLARVNAFFNRLRFVDDIVQWGRRDYWATPVEMLSASAGDCEDFSIAKYFTLTALGVPVDRLRLTYMKAVKLGRAHMVLAYFRQPRSEPLILDNLIDEIRPESMRPDLVPVYSFNRNGLWMSVARGRGRRVGSPSGLNRWRDLTERMAREDVWRS